MIHPSHMILELRFLFLNFILLNINASFYISEAMKWLILLFNQTDMVHSYHTWCIPYRRRSWRKEIYFNSYFFVHTNKTDVSDRRIQTRNDQYLIPSRVFSTTKIVIGLIRKDHSAAERSFLINPNHFSTVNNVLNKISHYTLLSWCYCPSSLKLTQVHLATSSIGLEWSHNAE